MRARTASVRSQWQAGRVIGGFQAGSKRKRAMVITPSRPAILTQGRSGKAFGGSTSAELGAPCPQGLRCINLGHITRSGSSRIHPRVSFKRRRFPVEIILLCVRWYCKYGVSYRDLAEMMSERGVAVDPSTIFRWVQRYAPEIEKRIRPYQGPQAPGGRDLRPRRGQLEILVSRGRQARSVDRLHAIRSPEYQRRLSFPA